MNWTMGGLLTSIFWFGVATEEPKSARWIKHYGLEDSLRVHMITLPGKLMEVGAAYGKRFWEHTDALCLLHEEWIKSRPRIVDGLKASTFYHPENNEYAASILLQLRKEGDQWIGHSQWAEPAPQYKGVEHATVYFRARGNQSIDKLAWKALQAAERFIDLSGARVERHQGASPPVYIYGLIRERTWYGSVERVGLHVMNADSTAHTYPVRWVYHVGKNRLKAGQGELIAPPGRSEFALCLPEWKHGVIRLYNPDKDGAYLEP